MASGGATDEMLTAAAKKKAELAAQADTMAARLFKLQVGVLISLLPG